MISSLLSKGRGKVVSVPSRTELCLARGGFLSGATVPVWSVTFYSPTWTFRPGKAELVKAGVKKNS